MQKEIKKQVHVNPLHAERLTIVEEPGATSRRTGPRPVIQDEPAAVDIRTMTNNHAEFYNTFGPFLGNREVRKDLHGPISDDPGVRWYAAYNEEGVVTGFATAEVKRDFVLFGSLWVRKQFRLRGIGRALAAKVAEDFAKYAMRTNATDASRAIFNALGFAAIGKRASLTAMERSPRRG